MNVETMIVFQGQHLRLYQSTCASDRVVVTFDYWRRDRSGFPEPKSGISVLKRGYDFMRVETRENDWFLNSDLDDLLDVCAHLLRRYRSVVYLGFSMGAFGALLLSQYNMPEKLIAVSPAFPKFRTDSAYIRESLVDGSQGKVIRVIIHYDGLIETDASAANLYLDVMGSGQLIEFRGGGHPATDYLTANGRYHELLDGWLVDNPNGNALKSIHRSACICSRVAPTRSPYDPFVVR